MKLKPYSDKTDRENIKLWLSKAKKNSQLLSISTEFVNPWLYRKFIEVVAVNQSPMIKQVSDPTSVEEGNKPLFIRAWKPRISTHVLKSLGESWKRKPKKDNICQRWTWTVTNGIRVRHQEMCQRER